MINLKSFKLKWLNHLIKLLKPARVSDILIILI